MKPNEKYFYCYSTRMHNFLQIFGIPYIEKGINNKSGKEFFKYQKSDRLDYLIEKWNSIKKEINLQDVIKKKK